MPTEDYYFDHEVYNLKDEIVSYFVFSNKNPYTISCLRYGHAMELTSLNDVPITAQKKASTPKVKGYRYETNFLGMS